MEGFRREAVWDPITRIWHWAFAVSVIAGWLLGEFRTYSLTQWHVWLGYLTGFLQIAPDFILEVRSRSQSVANQQQKMADWIDAGVKLGLLIDPESKTAWLYRPDGSVRQYARPATLSMEPEMPGLTLDFAEIWEFPWL